MKKLVTKISLALISGIVIFASSCNETDPLPISKAGFEVIDQNKLERFIPVRFVNLSTNAATFRWDFGDGTFDSLNISPEHIFEEEGTYDVSLIATTQDGQESTEIQSVDIKTRVLVAFTIANVSFVNQDGEPWDDDGTGPDLVFLFGAQSADFESYIVTDTAKNLTPADFPLEWEFQEGSGMELTNETYDLALLDADPEKTVDPKYDVMLGIEINPVLYNIGIKDEDDSGFLQISIGGFAIDLIVIYDLQ
jgi:hypothetical protein